MKITSLIFTLFLIYQTGSYSQTINYRSYEGADKFGSDVSWTLYRDQRGFIWAGPNGQGAVAYNGRDFLRFTEKDGLAGNFVIGFLHDSKDRMWFSSQGQGITLFDGRSMTTYSEADSLGLLTNNILCFHESKNGKVYLGTYGYGLQIFDGKRFTQIDSSQSHGMAIYKILEDEDGTLWMATRSHGLVCYRNDSIILTTPESGIPKGFTPDIGILDNGDILVCCDAGLFRYTPGEKAKRFDESIGLHAAYKARYCAVAEDGTIYLSADLSLYAIKDNEARLLNINGDLKQQCTKLLIDKSGYLWMSTNGHGIIQLIPNGFFSLSTPDEKIFTVAVDPEDNIYIASEKGIYRYNSMHPDSVVKLLDISGMQEHLSSLKVPEKDHLLFGINRLGGVYEYRPGYSNPKLISTDDMDDCIITESGNLIGLGKGKIFEVDLKTYKSRTIKLHDNPQALYYSICRDRSNNIWVGSYDEGLITRMNENDTVTFGPESGLPDGAVIQLVDGTDHHVWFLNIDGYYGYFNGNEFVTFPPVAQGEVFAFAQDLNGDIWFTGKFGIACSHLEDEKAIETTVYGEGDGIDLTASKIQSTILLADGRILSAKLSNKAYLFDPSKINPVNEQPDIYIAEVKGRDGVELDSSWYSESIGFFNLPQNLKLPYSENNLTISLGSVFFSYADSLKYTYLLQGYDHDWSNPKSEGTIVFTNLPGGKYDLLIKAYSPGSVESKILIYSFEVEIPWFQSWWFYAGCVLGGSGLVLVVFKWRLARVQREKAKLEMIVAERTREVMQEKEIVEEKNKAILDSINYARRLQNAILPTTEKLNQELNDYFLLYRPKDIVSGDFYWLESREEDVYFAVADCTGHGVPGAMVSTVCANALNKSLRELGKLSPGEILNSTRDLVIEHFSKGNEAVKDGMDITLARLNRKTLWLEFSGANNHLWIASQSVSGELLQLDADKQPVGNFAHAFPFNTVGYQLVSGDILYLASDGYPDQFGGEKGKKFKSANLKKLLFDIHQKPLNDQLTILQEHFERWKGDFEQVDDICLMGIRV